MGFKNVFAKLAAAEQAFAASQFLAPVVRGQRVRVRIAGVVIELAVEQPKGYEGWGVFRQTGQRAAALVRPATMTERRNYLALFPTVRLVACARHDDRWFGVPAIRGDRRFPLGNNRSSGGGAGANSSRSGTPAGTVPIRLASEIQMFDTVDCAYDGLNCWHAGSYRNASLKTAAALRKALSDLTDADKVECSEEEREAYLIALIGELENRRDHEEERIKAALARAGAQYRSYVKRGDAYTVEFAVDGKSHRSTVDSKSLSVLSAGICLSGGDAAFDLQSLVHVIREGDQEGRIVRVGDNREFEAEDDHY